MNIATFERSGSFVRPLKSLVWIGGEDHLKPYALRLSLAKTLSDPRINSLQQSPRANLV